jgi:hypothetical protein
VRLGRVRVLHERERRTRADGELAHQPVVGARVAEDPASAVHVDDDRQHARRPPRLDEAHPHLPDGGGNRDPLLVDRGLADRSGLGVFEDLPGIGRRHLIQERWLGERVSNLLCWRLEDDRDGSGHESAPRAKAG